MSGVFLKNIQRICPICLVRAWRNGQDRPPACLLPASGCPVWQSWHQLVLASPRHDLIRKDPWMILLVGSWFPLQNGWFCWSGFFVGKVLAPLLSLEVYLLKDQGCFCSKLPPNSPFWKQAKECKIRTNFGTSSYKILIGTSNYKIL
jgi:hypothetical protein